VTAWLAFVAVVVLVGLNGLFVAAEFAVVSARGPALDELAESGDRRALAVHDLLGRLPFFLSMVQFGITATSLLVGFLADRALGATFVRPALALIGVPEEASLALSVTFALIISTLLQMVLGELFPKNVAISRPLPVARRLAGFSRSSTVVLGPIVRILERAAVRVTRSLFRVEPPSRLDDTPGLDELGRIIAASGARGRLTSDQTEMLRRAVSLRARRVGEVMIPRPDVVWVRSGTSLSDMATLARTSGHSRFPIRGDSEDEVLGTVHIKDLLQVLTDHRGHTTVDDVAAVPLFVPESETLRGLLDELRQRRRTFAIVVDEFGSTAGIVTLEDVLEALVGDIVDEFDRDVRTSADGPGAGPQRMPGALALVRFAERAGIALPDGPYETLAGFVMAELGRVPEVGDRVVHEGLELVVARRDGLRVTEVAVRRLQGES
jgi:CBS domain containing-hemolysin-like protein